MKHKYKSKVNRVRKLTNNISPIGRGSETSYLTKGGELLPLANNTNLAVGNQHEENDIDNTNGIKLYEPNNANPKAEIENNEVIKDDTKVYSDNRMYDSKDTFASKLQKLATKRGKLEEQLEDTTDKITKNGISRMIDNINKEEEDVFKKQELEKLIEQNLNIQNNQEQNNTFEYDGGGDIGIRGSLQVAGSMASLIPEGGAIAGTALNLLGSIIGGKERQREAKKLKERQLGMQALEQAKSDAIYLQEHSSDTFGNVGSEYYKDGGKMKYGSNGVDLSDDTEQDNTEQDKIDKELKKAKNKQMWKSIGEGAVSVADNIGNIILTANAPKIPTPLLNRALPFKTKVNVNPQLSKIRDTEKAIEDAVLNNTSNSNVARNIITSTRLRGSEQENQILADKENKETMLTNEANVKNEQISQGNTALLNNYENQKFIREGDIQSQISGNLADISKDIQNRITMSKLQKNDDEKQMLDLLNDETGSKLNAYLSNPEFVTKIKSNPALLKLITERGLKINTDTNDFDNPTTANTLKNVLGIDIEKWLLEKNNGIFPNSYKKNKMRKYKFNPETDEASLYTNYEKDRYIS